MLDLNVPLQSAGALAGIFDMLVTLGWDDLLLSFNLLLVQIHCHQRFHHPSLIIDCLNQNGPLPQLRWLRRIAERRG